MISLHCGAGEDSWESLGQQEIKPVSPQGNQSWLFIGRTDAEAEAPILWPPDANADIRKGHDAGKNWRQGEKVTREDEIVGWYHWPIWHEFEQTPGIAEDRKAWCAAVHGISMSWTGLSNWTAETMNKLLNMLYFNPRASHSHLSVRTVVLYTEIAFSYLSTAT